MASPRALRAKFYTRLKREQPDFHTKDLERIKDDQFLTKYLNHKDNNLNSALDLLWSNLEWRKSLGVNDISEKNINLDYIKHGSFYPHGRDRDGCKLFIFEAKKYVKGAWNVEELKKCILYWFERLEREEKGKKITLFANTEGAGLANIEMDFVKFFMSLFSHYYPDILNQIIGFEVPWVLSSVFIVIKQILPEKHSKNVKFTNRSNISKVIPLDQLPRTLGGTSDYVFEFIPESNLITKHVHFAQGIYDKIQVEPSEAITFFEETNGDYAGDITIKNFSDTDLAFKIRTTAPKKFRVNPNSKILMRGATQKVTIYVESEPSIENITKEKFLIMTVDIPQSDLSSDSLNELWSKNDLKVEEYRLKCELNKDIFNSVACETNASEDNPRDGTLLDIDKKLERLIYLNYVSIFVLILFIVWFSFIELLKQLYTRI